MKPVYETVENLIIDLIIEQKKNLLWISIRCDKYCGFVFFKEPLLFKTNSETLKANGNTGKLQKN